MMENEIPLKPGERLDDLQTCGYKLIQRRDAFRFGTDSVLLADFAAPRKGERVADLGSGTGAVATLMAAHQADIHVDAIEVQPEMADMLRRSVALNGLTDVIAVHEMDMRDAASALGCGRMSLCACNPPYGRDGGALQSASEAKRIARHECGLSPSDICRAAARLLKNGGRLAVVYPAPRAFEMMRAMHENGLAPKRIRTVHGFAGRAPKFVLMDAVKGGGDMLHWLEPLVMYEADGSPTAEWKRIYRVEEK